MNLRDLEYFVAVAEVGHFGQAATRCHCSQPTLSGQLRRLERELGAPLFERGSGRTRLTVLGEQCLAPAREAIAQAQCVAQLGQAARDPFSGDLTLGAIPTIGPYLWPTAMPALRRAFPKLTFLLREEQTRPLLAALRDGRLDAGILAVPVETQGLELEALWDEPFVLAVPTRHALARRATVEIGALAGCELLLLEDGHCLRDQALAVCAEAGAHEHTGFRGTSLATLREMVRAGVGTTLLPRSAARAEPGLAMVALDPPPNRHIALVWRRSHPRAPALQRLAAALRAGAPR